MNTNTIVNNTESQTQETTHPTPDNPTAPTTPKPPRLRTRSSRYRSDISRLPHGVREMVNQALREGMSYLEIIGRVEILTDKFHGVTPGKLSAWYRTGYADWLREKTRLEHTLIQSAAALESLTRLKQQTGATLPELAQTFLASLIQKVLQDFNPENLVAMLTEKPAECFRLIACLNDSMTAFSRHQKTEIARVRCQVELAKTSEEVTAKAPVPAKELFDAERMRSVMAALGSPADRLVNGLAARAAEVAPEKPHAARRAAKLSRKKCHRPNRTATHPEPTCDPTDAAPPASPLTPGISS